MPDQQGLIAGKPNPNVLRPGDDILFVSHCGGLCGWTVELQLRDERMREIPVSFESIEPSPYFRVHPATPLTPGSYTLNYAGSHGQEERCDELVYVFRVEGEASSQGPEYVTALGAQKYGLDNGEPFHCSYWAPNNDEGGEVFLNSRPYRDVEIKLTAPVSQPTNPAFLSRPRVTKGSGVPSVSGWTARIEDYAYWRLNDQLPNVCFVLESLQISTLQVSSSEEHCFAFTSDGAPYDPKPFAECAMRGLTYYARAWCDTNRAACSSSNPRAAEASVRNVCATYVDICAPLLGKRAEAEGVCP